MAEEVIISNPESLAKFKEAVACDGAKSLHVVADFDRTLTTAYVEGKKVPSQISVLRDGDYISNDYALKAHALAEKYQPIEMNPNVTLAEKRKAMHEWWSSHFKLLIESGLNKKHIESVVNSGKVRFRPSTLEFLALLHENSIPLLILSSCGLGTYAIQLQLQRQKANYPNISIVSNEYEWNEKGQAVGVKEPIIHNMNKEEASIKHYPAFKAIKDRKNVLLLGDGLSDVDMVKGFKPSALLKIAFLNEDIEKNLVCYKKAYDIILLNDSPMTYVYELVKGLIK